MIWNMYITFNLISQFYIFVPQTYFLYENHEFTFSSAYNGQKFDIICHTY